MGKPLISIKEGVVRGPGPQMIEEDGERWYIDTVVGRILGVTRQTMLRWCHQRKIVSYNQQIDDIPLEVRRGVQNKVHYLSERTVENIMDIMALRSYYRI